MFIVRAYTRYFPNFVEESRRVNGRKDVPINMQVFAQEVCLTSVLSTIRSASAEKQSILILQLKVTIDQI